VKKDVLAIDPDSSGHDGLGAAYLDMGHVIPLHRSDASPLVEFDLPDAAEVGQEILDAIPVLDVPHFQGAIGTGDDLLPIVLETGDGTGVSAERGFALAVFGVPDTEGRVCGGGDEALGVEVEEADEGGVAVQGVEDGSRVQRPDLDEVVHRAADAAVTIVVEDDAVDFLSVPLETMHGLTGRDLPDTNGAIIAPADKGVRMCCDGAHRVLMTGKDADEVGTVRILLRRTGLEILSISRLRKLPDSEIRVTGTRDDQ
jgi:hypothetical protein